MSTKPLLIMVGGFLGAGKTTLILAAAEMLQRHGTRVAVITNDQGEHLVDTHRILADGIDAAEIGGGCFCCRFSDLIDSLDHVMRFEPEVIFAEPAGSCTDIAATVLRPLLSLYAGRFRLAPFTVLVDPAIADRALETGGHDSLQFLFEHQLREADVLCYTKADRHDQFPPMDNPPLRLSAITGEGVREWLDLVSAWAGEVGSNTLTIDYDRYAAAEASLGWLNARVEVELRVPASPSHFVGPLLDRLEEQLSSAGARIIHLKIFDQTDSSYLKASMVLNAPEPSVEGDLLAPAERRHTLIINLRAIAGPEQLRRVVENELEQIEGEAGIEMQAFAPAYPKPEKRIPVQA